MEFKVTLAQDYCLKVADGTHDSPKNTEQGNKLITSRHLEEFHLDFDNANLISKEDYHEINKRSKVDQFDILFSMIGTVGKVYLERNSEINYAIKNVGLFKNKSELEAKWLNYYLLSSSAQEYVYQNLRGSTQQYIPLGALRKLPIKHPLNTEDMERIIKILDDVDNKRDLNNQTINTLEQLAQTLFKRWFVDFEFPNENGDPYKSSGGEMVESELGMIPKHWSVDSISNFSIRLQSGGTPSRKKIEYWSDGKIPWIKTKEIKNNYIIGSEENITKLGLQKSSAKLFEKDTILIAMYGATAGQLAMLKFPASTNQACCGITNKYPNYLYQELLLKQEYIKSLATGSAQQNLSKEIISNIKLIIPCEKMLTMAEDIFCDFTNLIEKNTYENYYLKNLRDALLPKLLSGEIELPDEIEVTDDVPIS